MITSYRHAVDAWPQSSSSNLQTKKKNLWISLIGYVDLCFMFYLAFIEFMLFLWLTASYFMIYGVIFILCKINYRQKNFLIKVCFRTHELISQINHEKFSLLIKIIIINFNGFTFFM